MDAWTLALLGLQFDTPADVFDTADDRLHDAQGTVQLRRADIEGQCIIVSLETIELPIGERFPVVAVRLFGRDNEWMSVRERIGHNKARQVGGGVEQALDVVVVFAGRGFGWPWCGLLGLKGDRLSIGVIVDRQSGLMRGLLVSSFGPVAGVWLGDVMGLADLAESALGDAKFAGEMLGGDGPDAIVKGLPGEGVLLWMGCCRGLFHRDALMGLGGPL